jgi:transposase
MAKYDKQFKLKVVKQYLAGKDGSKRLGQAYGLAHSVIEQWVAGYRQHGVAALTKKHTHYDASFKMTVLHRMWRQELSCRQVAALFDIRNPSAVRVWERQYHAGGVGALAPKPRGRPKTMADPLPPNADDPSAPDDGRSRKELLKELEYLRAENAYLKKLDALIQAKKAATQKKRG